MRRAFARDIRQMRTQKAVLAGSNPMCVLEADDDLPVGVRPKEGPSHLRSSPPASRESVASKRGVEPSVGDHRRVQTAGPQHEAKPAAPKGMPARVQRGAEPGLGGRRPWPG